MSSDDDDTTVICGSGGEPEGDVQIWMYKASVLGVAIAVDPKALSEYPGVSKREARAFRRMILRDWEKWAECLEDLGVPYQRHDPHPANFND